MVACNAASVKGVASSGRNQAAQTDASTMKPLIGGSSCSPVPGSAILRRPDMKKSRKRLIHLGACVLWSGSEPGGCRTSAASPHECWTAAIDGEACSPICSPGLASVPCQTAYGAFFASKAAARVCQPLPLARQRSNATGSSRRSVTGALRVACVLPTIAVRDLAGQLRGNLRHLVGHALGAFAGTRRRCAALSGSQRSW